jgi:hypothetical protein
LRSGVILEWANSKRPDRPRMHLRPWLGCHRQRHYQSGANKLECWTTSTANIHSEYSAQSSLTKYWPKQFLEIHCLNCKAQTGN